MVDNDKGCRESLALALKKIGRFSISEAENGLEGLELIRARNGLFNLVVTELYMAVMLGEQMIRIIREEYPNIPIIVVTGFPTIKMVKKLIPLGVVDFLSKPIDVKELQSSVINALEK